MHIYLQHSITPPPHFSITPFWYQFGIMREFHAKSVNFTLFIFHLWLDYLIYQGFCRLSRMAPPLLIRN
jgi:hypothetical protein